MNVLWLKQKNESRKKIMALVKNLSQFTHDVSIICYNKTVLILRQKMIQKMIKHDQNLEKVFVYPNELYSNLNTCSLGEI